MTTPMPITTALLCDAILTSIRTGRIVPVRVTMPQAAAHMPRPVAQWTAAGSILSGMTRDGHAWRISIEGE